MKNTVLYYSNKEIIDRIAKILQEKIECKIDDLRENLFDDMSHLSDEKLVSIRDQINELNLYHQVLENSKLVLSLDTEKLEDMLGLGIFKHMKESLSEFVLSELHRQDISEIGDSTIASTSITGEAFKDFSERVEELLKKKSKSLDGEIKSAVGDIKQINTALTTLFAEISRLDSDLEMLNSVIDLKVDRRDYLRD